jgi:hypothetical protein
MIDFIAILQGLGVPVSTGLVIWFVYRNDKREAALTARIEALETRYAATLEGTVKDCRSEIVKSGELLKRIEPFILRAEHAR